MSSPKVPSRRVAAGSQDPGYRLVSVSRLSELCNPFANPPWEDVAGLTIEGVRDAIKDGLRKTQAYSADAHASQWTVEDHIARIAHLATVGWVDPIHVDVGIPFMSCWVDWPLLDGNHRMAAAMVRGDARILASVAGCCQHMREVLGRSLKPKAPPAHAAPWTP